VAGRRGKKEAKPKGVHRVVRIRKDGAEFVYWYAWRGRGAPRLEGEPGTPEFYASLAKALKRGPAAGTFGDLLRRYEEAPEFTGLRERTRQDYAQRLGAIETAFGDLPIAALNDPRVREEFLEWRDGIAGRSARQADYAWTVLARVLAWGRHRGLIRFNHAEKGGKLYHADRSDMIWTEDQIRVFLDAAPAPLALAMIVAKETGQRQGDLLALPWSAYDGDAVSIRQSKGGQRVAVPATRELKAALDSAPKTSTIILTSSTGRPWNAHAFQEAWRKASRKVGIADLHFHDLRGTAVTRLAEHGCTVPEICAITGHSLRDAGAIVDRYLARSPALAKAAILKLERGRDGTKV